LTRKKQKTKSKSKKQRKGKTRSGQELPTSRKGLARKGGQEAYPNGHRKQKGGEKLIFVKKKSPEKGGVLKRTIGASGTTEKYGITRFSRLQKSENRKGSLMRRQKNTGITGMNRNESDW